MSRLVMKARIFVGWEFEKFGYVCVAFNWSVICQRLINGMIETRYLSGLNINEIWSRQEDATVQLDNGLINLNFNGRFWDFILALDKFITKFC